MESRYAGSDLARSKAIILIRLIHRSNRLSDFGRHPNSRFTQKFNDQFNKHHFNYRWKWHPAPGLGKDREQGSWQHFGMIGEYRHIAGGQHDGHEQAEKTNNPQEACCRPSVVEIFRATKQLQKRGGTDRRIRTTIQENKDSPIQ